MPDVLGGLLARQSPSMGSFLQRYLSGALSPSPRVKAAKALMKAAPERPGLLGELALAPVRAMTAQPEQSPGSRFPGLLGRLIDATDPVQAFGGYGNVAAMGLPVGGPKLPRLSPKLRVASPAVQTESGKIYTGANHGEAAQKAWDDGATKIVDNNGFVTSSGDFVNRRTAFEIAERGGQIDKSVALKRRENQETNLTHRDLGGAIPGLLGRFPTTTPGRIINQTAKEKGYTVNVKTGEVPEEGLMMGVYPNKDPRTTVVSGKLTRAPVTKHAETNVKALQKPEHHYGTWVEDTTGLTYLDVSKRFKPEQIRAATKFGEKTGQKSGFDIGKKEGFKVGNWTKFVTGKAFKRRLRSGAAEGEAYMSKQPTQDWWEMPDVTRVYGHEFKPQTSGLLSATSGNTVPVRNVQGMSEYMRRVIKDEPIIQPKFRVPETAMGGLSGPGKKMPMEYDRRHNLLAAARGDLEAMRGEVIREKNQALMGDPLAIVLDRIWARGSEVPKRGIFAMAQEGVVPKGAARQLMKDPVIELAEEKGITPRMLGAQIWAGFRERVKRTGKLFGQEYPATQRSTLSSESRSYNDEFVSLIEKKAKQLNVSVPEVERRLKAGDFSLLSWLLATPLGAKLYEEMRSTRPRT